MDLLDGWRTDQQRRGLMPSTIYRRTSMVRAWLRWCDDHQLAPAAATEADVQRFLDARRVGDRTRYTWISAIGCFYKWATRDGILPTDPTERIIRPKLRRTLPRPISDEDLTMALALSRGQQHAWFVLAAYAGLRCAEIAGIQRDDVLHADGLLRVTGKGGKDRLLPMHDLVLEALAAQPRPRQNRHLFQRPQGGPWPPALVSAHSSQFLRDVGIDATIHQFRHWFATRTLQRSGNLRTVQGLLGHSSPTTTAIYTAFCDQDARDAVRALRPPEGQPALW